MKDERRIAVAYSGGRDSTALLHATLVEAAAQGVIVMALHVHHGLSEHAEAWLEHCAAQCSKWARRGLPVEFMAHRLSARPAKGESLEAWARDARYAALGTMAKHQGAAVVLLAHHQRDQAETFMLQALRGAGVDGLSGMPSSVVRDGITWQRPWLDKPRSAIDAYVRRHRLRHIEDDSNLDPRFARNRLRLDVWPALTAAFEQADGAFATSARWAQEAASALDELALLDAGSAVDGQALNVATWMELSAARRSNLLRAWLRSRTGASAPASLVTRLLDEVPATRSARWQLGGGELRLHRGLLLVELSSRREGTSDAIASSKGVESAVQSGGKGAIEVEAESTLGIRRAGTYALPGWSGSLLVERTRESGVPLAWLAHLELRARKGSERYQSGLGRPPRSLKKQFQAAGVAAWDRTGPLIYSGGQLIFVPGLGIDARMFGLPGQAMVTLRWLPDAAPIRDRAARSAD